MEPDVNPSGICMCGCGRPTKIVRHNEPSRGRFVGHHNRYLQGHSSGTPFLSTSFDVLPETLRCGECRETKPLAAFPMHARSRRGRGYLCWECKKAVKDDQKDERWRNRTLLTKYGINVMEWNEMNERQGGVCAICKRPESKRNNAQGVSRLSVDHCHKTNRVRGLLCSQCNLLLHHLEDRGIPDLIERAKAYLAISAIL